MQIRFSRSLLTIALGAVLLTGCAGSDKAQQQAAATSQYQDPRDPLESINRPIWNFNYDILDPYVIRPATVGYMTVVPKPARSGLANMADNLTEPASFVNSILQWKPDRAAISAGRFLVNSTIGVLGLFDVATRIGLEAQNEDFDQTLAVWGLGDGGYLMLPAMGPTTTRGLVGGVADNLYFPMVLLNTPLSVASFVVRGLDGREQLMSMEQMLEDSLDPYAFIKEAYYQRQEFKIYDGNPPQKDEADIDEDFLNELLGEK